jgi:hypothetical protein
VLKLGVSKEKTAPRGGLRTCAPSAVSSVYGRRYLAPFRAWLEATPRSAQARLTKATNSAPLDFHIFRLMPRSLWGFGYFRDIS